ncbi:MAG: aldo/keto reductase [Desulfobacter sp.]
MTDQQLTRVPFGNTKTMVTRAGLGGEGVLRTQGRDRAAQNVIQAAVDRGIGYFDSARVYMDSELYYGRYWKANPGARQSVFHTSKSAERTREGALAELDQTLQRLGTDYLDLWQIHDVRGEGDLRRISQKGGALEAFVAAREAGKVKHIGVTGHHDPEILTRAVRDWPVDAVLLPVNPVEEIIGGFLTHTLEAAHKKGIAVIGMKVLGASHYIAEDMGITPKRLIRYALSFDITTVIVGCKTPEEVNTLVDSLAAPALSTDQRRETMAPFVPAAEKLAFYRGSVFNRP